MTNCEELKRQVEAYLAQKKISQNELIGRGVCLTPPYSCKVDSRANQFEVTIIGRSGKVTIQCDWISTSKYRDEIRFVLNTANGPPIIRKLAPLQPARRKMLDTIPPDSNMAPADFYRKTSGEEGTQVNARRRWGELRTEFGFGTIYNEVMFARQGEFPVSDPSPRPNMSRLNADYYNEVYEAHNGQCAKCGRTIRTADDANGEPGLLDHRRPVPFGGSDDRENLQLFCVTCNNIKGTACQRCQLNYACELCTWAHPEKFHDAIVIRLTAEQAKRLVELSESAGQQPAEYAFKLFKQEFDKT